jgi:hypothetical protein
MKAREITDLHFVGAPVTLKIKEENDEIGNRTRHYRYIVNGDGTRYSGSRFKRNGLCQCQR